MGRGRRGSGVEVHGDKLRIRFTFNGKRFAEPLDLAATPPNIKAATRMSAEVRQKIVLGVFDHAATFPNSKNVERQPEIIETVKDYAGRWVMTLTGEKSTVDGYKAQMEGFWVPELGELALPAVKHTDIATAIAEKAAEGITGKTTNNLLIPIRAMFAAAVADKKITSSPVSQIHNRRHQKPPIDPFSRDEMDMIVGRLSTGLQVIYNYFLFAFTTGMRPSELIALRWGDIDWNRRTAQVSRAQVRHKEKGTKTHQVRDVDLNDLAVTALTAQKAHTFLRGPDVPIFCDPSGARWLSERKLREDFFHPALKACGIRRRPAYNTRHTYATVALMNGVNPAYIARQLGHANTAMLFKHYAKWIEGADSGLEARKLNLVFGPKLAHKITDAN